MNQYPTIPFVYSMKKWLISHSHHINQSSCTKFLNRVNVGLIFRCFPEFFCRSLFGLFKWQFEVSNGPASTRAFGRPTHRRKKDWTNKMKAQIIFPSLFTVWDVSYFGKIFLFSNWFLWLLLYFFCLRLPINYGCFFLIEYVHFNCWVNVFPLIRISCFSFTFSFPFTL
jgi:hypothetical protein